MGISFLYYGIIVVNTIAFLLGRKIKLIYIPSAFFLILFVMGKRFNGSAIAYDLESYKNRFENVDEISTLEIGYKLLNVIGNNILNLSFETFYMILVAIIIITILVSVNKIKGNYHLLLLCWFIYYVNISMDQLRNQSALAVMMVSIFPLCYSSKYNVRKVLLFLALASTFHISFVLYAVPLFLTYKKDIGYAVRWFVFFMAVYLILMFSSSTSFFESIISMFVSKAGDTDKYDAYVGSHTSLSSLASVSIYVIILLSIYLLKKDNIKYIGERNNYFCDNINLFLSFLLFSSILLPFLLVNAAFYRIVRDLSFIAIIYLGINSTKETSCLIKRIKILMFSLAISIGWFIFDIIIKGHFLDYSLYFFENELL